MRYWQPTCSKPTSGGLWQAAEQSGTLPGQLVRVDRRVKGLGLYPLPEKLLIPNIDSALAITLKPEPAERSEAGRGAYGQDRTE